MTEQEQDEAAALEGARSHATAALAALPPASKGQAKIAERLIEAIDLRLAWLALPPEARPRTGPRVA